MSPAHFWFGASALKSRSSRLGAMLNLWLLSPSRQIALQSPVPLPCSTCKACVRGGNGRHLVFPRSHHRYAVLTHQTANTSMADVQTDLFQFLSHARATVATQAETGLFLDMRQRDHIRSLPAAGWPTAERTQTAHADIHNLTQARCRKRIPVFFPSRACKHALPGSGQT